MSNPLLVALLLTKMAQTPPSNTTNSTVVTKSATNNLLHMMMAMQGQRGLSDASASLLQSLIGTPAPAPAVSAWSPVTARSAALPAAPFTASPVPLIAPTNTMLLSLFSVLAGNNANNAAVGYGGGNRIRRNRARAGLPVNAVALAPRPLPAIGQPIMTQAQWASSQAIPGSSLLPAATPLTSAAPAAGTNSLGLTSSDIANARTALGGQAGIDAIYAQLGGKEKVMEMIRTGQGLPPGFQMPSAILALGNKVNPAALGSGGGYDYEYYDPDTGLSLPSLSPQTFSQFPSVAPPSTVLQPAAPAAVSASNINGFSNSFSNANSLSTSVLPNSNTLSPVLPNSLSTSQTFPGSTSLSTPVSPNSNSLSTPQVLPTITQQQLQQQQLQQQLQQQQQQQSQGQSQQQQQPLPQFLPLTPASQRLPSQQSQQSQPQFQQPQQFQQFQQPLQPFASSMQQSPQPQSPSLPTSQQNQFSLSIQQTRPQVPQPQPKPQLPQPQPAFVPSVQQPQQQSQMSNVNTFSQSSFPSQQQPQQPRSFNPPLSSPSLPSFSAAPVANAPRPQTSAPAAPQANAAAGVLNAIGGQKALADVFASIGGQAGLEAIYNSLGGRDAVLKMVQSGQGLPPGFTLPPQLVELNAKLRNARAQNLGGGGGYDYEYYYVDDNGMELSSSASLYKPTATLSQPSLPSSPMSSPKSAPVATPASMSTGTVPAPLFAPPNPSFITGGGSLFDFLENGDEVDVTTGASANLYPESAAVTGKGKVASASSLTDRLAAAQNRVIGGR